MSRELFCPFDLFDYRFFCRKGHEYHELIAAGSVDLVADKDILKEDRTIFEEKMYEDKEKY